MPASKVRFGSIQPWISPNGKVVRLPGEKGFRKYNQFYVQNYVRNLERVAKDTLYHKLPSFCKNFLDNTAIMGVIPWATGNLHDSLVVAVAHKNSSGAYVLTDGRAIRTRSVAKKPQRWGWSLSGLERHSKGSYFEGYGRDYVAGYEGAIRDEGEIVLDNDVVVVLEATIPYAGVLNDDVNNPENGWFNNLTDLFIDRMRAEVNILVSPENISTDDGVFAGIASQIGL